MALVLAAERARHDMVSFIDRQSVYDGFAKKLWGHQAERTTNPDLWRRLGAAIRRRCRRMWMHKVESHLTKRDMHDGFGTANAKHGNDKAHQIT